MGISLLRQTRNRVIPPQMGPANKLNSRSVELANFHFLIKETHTTAPPICMPVVSSTSLLSLTGMCSFYQVPMWDVQLKVESLIKSRMYAFFTTLQCGTELIIGYGF